MRALEKNNVEAKTMPGNYCVVPSGLGSMRSAWFYGEVTVILSKTVVFSLLESRFLLHGVHIYTVWSFLGIILASWERAPHRRRF